MYLVFKWKIQKNSMFRLKWFIMYISNYLKSSLINRSGPIRFLIPHVFPKRNILRGWKFPSNGEVMHPFKRRVCWIIQYIHSPSHFLCFHIELRIFKYISIGKESQCWCRESDLVTKMEPVMWERTFWELDGIGHLVLQHEHGLMV